MPEFLEQNIVAACWLGLSLILLVLEATVFTSVLVWFGIGAGIVGLYAIATPAESLISVPWQFVCFALISGGMLLIHRRYLRTDGVVDVAGDIDTTLRNAPQCHVESVDEPGLTGIVRFEGAFMGDRHWPFVSATAVSKGDSVCVLSVSGNILGGLKIEVQHFAEVKCCDGKAI